MQDVIKKIYEYSLEEIMGQRFGRYAKSIIQDRALPDIRDGLKPVQRRILFSMYKNKQFYNDKYTKCARIVGDVMGKYHPHGDSSIYEALVRLSQPWKQNELLIDVHGNNGSPDGDGPAAMRYTEARLAKIANELLRDLDKMNPEILTWNYDDTLQEPTVLPARFPNLLVNGSSGISAGYATNIPPHNLGEVIDATILRLHNPNCTLEEIMEIIKGPDFPTGAIVEGKAGIVEAFETGRGKVIVRAHHEFIKNQIIIKDIPYEVNKALLVKKINDIRLDKKIDGIVDARDESDREGMRIAIDLKKDADKEFILNYLFKNTELQTTYSYNMVSIVNKRPMTLGIIPMLDAYITHQKIVIKDRTEFDLAVAKKQYHITEGLIKALSILDDVIKTIRASKNKADAKINLVKQYDFTEEQAEAIVTLQLYRLTNFDVQELITKKSNLEKIMKGLETILENPKKLLKVIEQELTKIKEEYATPRKTEIKDEITEIKLETNKIIPKEDVIALVTKEGYVKRVSLRSFNATEGETALKENDYVIGKYQLTTLDTILLFTDLGNYLYVPVFELPDLKYKDLGKHISNIIKMNPEESIIASFPVTNFDAQKTITIFTKEGMVKRTNLSDFKVQRYSKPILAIKLKEEDRVVTVTDLDEKYVFIATHNGYGLTYLTEEIPVTGLRTSGVKAITLKNDFVVNADLYNEMDETVTVITRKNTMKRIRLSEFEITARARKGVLLVRDVKTNPYYLLKIFITSHKNRIGLKTKNGIEFIKVTESPIADRTSTGTSISKVELEDVFVEQNLNKEEIKEEKQQVSLEEIDNRILTIDDFLEDFKLKE